VLSCLERESLKTGANADEETEKVDKTFRFEVGVIKLRHDSIRCDNLAYVSYGFN
jgi:hypothetical protein